MTRPRVEPFVWLMFSGGGVMAALFLPILAGLFAFAIPFGWVDAPSHAHLVAVIGHPLTKLALFGMFALMLVHAAHRFRYTLYDGLQIKEKALVAVFCYGAAAACIIVSVPVLLSV